MSEETDSARQTKIPGDRSQEPQQKWGAQTVGALIGGALGLLVALGLRQVGWGGENLFRFALWGGVVGAVLSDVASLELAGRKLTRRDTKWLNILVAVAAMAVFFMLIYGLLAAFALLLRQFTAS